MKILKISLHTSMETSITRYHSIKGLVTRFSKILHFYTFLNKTGRKLAIALEDIISLAIFKQTNQIETKKSLYQIFDNLNCSYKTLVINLNRWYFLAVIILTLIMKFNTHNQHPIKHIDSTGIPVCLFKNAKAHQTMKGLAQFGKTSKGTVFGLKLHIISDFKRKILSIKFTGANVNDQKVVLSMSKKIWGILIGDAGYVSEKIANAFKAGGRFFLFKPRTTMKKLMTKFEQKLYDTRALIELNFRNLKMFYGLITSLPRSIDGYLANYIYSLLAYILV